MTNSTTLRRQQSAPALLGRCRGLELLISQWGRFDQCHLNIVLSISVFGYTHLSGGLSIRWMFLRWPDVSICSTIQHATLRSIQ